MRQLILSLKEDADIPALVNFFETYQGISSFEIVEEAEEDWFDEEFLANHSDERLEDLLEKSSKQIEEGKYTEMTPEKLEEIFSKYRK